MLQKELSRSVLVDKTNENKSMEVNQNRETYKKLYQQRKSYQKQTNSSMTKTQYLNFNDEINKITDATLLKKKLETQDLNQNAKGGFNSTMSSYSTTSKLNHSSYLSNPV